MRWQGGRRSTNVEDRRGMSGGMVAGGGIGAVVIALLAMFLGVDPGAIGAGGGGGAAPAPAGGQGGAPGGYTGTAREDSLAEMVAVVLGDTEQTWNTLFQRMGAGDYQEPRLVLFSGYERTACGTGQSAMGPFYCPADKSVYIDLSFYEDLERQLGAPGDFAQAYVIAHEVGHHVQNELGISGEVQAAKQRVSQEEANRLSVMLELQADCLAGVWGYHARQSGGNIELDPGDAEEALTAASAIGDDRLQKRSQGEVVPESFTHGTSEQRMRWFRRGFDTGDPDQCDTFKAATL